MTEARVEVPSSLADVPGLRVGHATDEAGITGCTVVLAPGGAVAGVDVRGSAPGTRETDLLRPTALVERIHAVLLAGGSAFGLAAADGVMRWLAEREIGVETGVRPVPVVPAAIIFDLGVGDPRAYPDAAMGYAACEAATRGSGPLEGSVGAGTGATVGKLVGPGAAMKGGIGTAALRLPDGTVVGALAVTNALGNVVDGSGAVLAGARDGSGGFVDVEAGLVVGEPGARSGSAVGPRSGSPVGPPATSGRAPQLGGGTVEHTTLAVIGTDARLDRAQCRKLAELGHDALAQAIRPVHTMLDGDTVFVLATGASGIAPVDVPAAVRLGVAAVRVLRRAIERSVLAATSRGGVPAASDRRSAQRSP